jgi:hypothetical protein
MTVRLSVEPHAIAENACAEPSARAASSASPRSVTPSKTQRRPVARDRLAHVDVESSVERIAMRLGRRPVKIPQPALTSSSRALAPMTVPVPLSPAPRGLGLSLSSTVGDSGVVCIHSGRGPMVKYHPYSRRVFRRRLVAWGKRNLKLIAALTSGLLVLIAAETVLLAVVLNPSAFTWWVLGVFHATMVAIYLHMMHTAFLAHDREAIVQLRGAWGEDNTRSELQRAKRKRVIWGWVDSINLQAGDLDHLVITRRGGLVAIDSKWRNQASDTIDMARAAHRARVRAEGLAQTLLQSERRARHRAKANPLGVAPVVVLWGAAQHDVPDNARVDGIDFVAGQRLGSWLAQLDGRPVDKPAAADIIDRLERYRAAAWEPTDTAARLPAPRPIKDGQGRLP